MARACMISSIANFEYGNIVSITREFTAIGYDNEVDAVAAVFLLADCPESIASLNRHNATPEWQGDQPNGTRDYRVAVTWDTLALETVDREYVSGAMQLRPIKQYYSYAIVSRINDTGEILPPAQLGKAWPLGYGDGVDSDEWVLGFQIRRLYPKGTIDVPLVLALRNYINRPNIAVWRGFGIGTIKLVMVDFNDEAPNWDHITWTFAYAETYENITFLNPNDDPIVVPELYGWNYLDIHWSEVPDPVTQEIMRGPPWGVEIHQLKPFVDLNDVI